MVHSVICFQFGLLCLCRKEKNLGWDWKIKLNKASKYLRVKKQIKKLVCAPFGPCEQGKDDLRDFKDLS